MAEAQAVVARNKEKVRLNLDDAQAHKALGDAYLVLEEYKNAYDSYSEARRVTPGDAEAYRGMGAALEGGRQYARARDFYREAIRLDPQFARAQLGLGKMLVRLFQYQDAVGPLKEGIRLTPRGKVEHNDYFNLGKAYLHMGQYQDAVGAYQQALEVAPQYESTHTSIAEAYNGLKQYDKAVASAERTLKISPNNGKANRVLGDSHAGMERYDKAVEYYKESIRVSANRYQIEALLGLGLTYIRMGRHEEAVAAFEKGVQYASTPKQFSVEDEIEPWLLPAHYFGLAQANLNIGRGQAAAAASRKFIEIRSWADTNAPYAALMWYFGSRQDGRTDEALKVLEEAFKHMEAKAWPYPVFQYLRGDLKGDDLLASATDRDKMTEARAYVGMSLNLAGRPDEARPHLEWVVKNGNRNFVEYMLAQAELVRLARGPAARLLAPGNPPLTREVSDTVAEFLAFLLTELGKPFVADQQFKDEWAKMLAARYASRTAAEQERLSHVPEIWAAIRASWPQMSEEERAKYRAEWREVFKQGLADSRTKEQVEAEKSLQTLQALIRTGQQRPLQPAELSAAADHMDAVATGLRQLGGGQNEAMAAQMTQTAQQFRAAAQQGGAISTLPNPPANPSGNQAADRPDPHGAVRMVQRMNSNHFSTMSMIQFMSRRF
jgi:tetratricopeptide (TPR) repeat protein